MGKILEFAKNMHQWFIKNEYKGYDPYQIDEKASGLINKFPILKSVRKTLKPLHVFLPKTAFSSLPKIYHPKAIGLIIGGNAFLYKKTGQANILNENTKLLMLLNELKNKNYKYNTWGSPFEWGTKPRYPINTPAIPIVCPIGNALLDYYEICGDKRVLEMAVSIGLHIVKENGFKEVDKNKICLYYSPVDKIEVYNTNAIATRFLFRLNQYQNNQEQIIIAKKICNFIIDGQNEDGSWYYSTTSTIIDNRHTGYILESFKNILTIWSDNNLMQSYQNGLNFYYKKLINENLPRWSPEKTYPIDIHDIAQSIITYTTIEEFEKAEFIADFAIQNMSNNIDEFYFKIFKNNKVNKNVFIRWGQAWMYYAITKLINYKKQ